MEHTKMDIRIHSTTLARHLLMARAQGRVALSRAATEAFQRAEAILAADAILGSICDAELHDALVPQMAENAYAIGLIVRGLDDVSLIDILPDERILWSTPALELSISGFGVLAHG